MGKTNYQLSPQFELIEDPDFLTARGYNSTALLDKMQNELLLLNPVIATFLRAFQQPASLQDVVHFFQKDTEDSAKDIEAVLKPFFKSMRDRQIIEPCKTAVFKPQMPNGEGLQLGGYTLLKRLACQPPIDIYKAEAENGQPVLLKRLLFAPNFPESQRKKDRLTFAHEFKILKILSGCPNICPLIEFDKQQDFAVIEYFEGDTLRRLFKQKQRFSVEEKIGIFKQILKTAAFMHSSGVLHGDWHYENVLINAENVVKIIDFDLALKIGQKDQKGIIRGGIREFIPPERIDDSAFEVATTPPDFRAEVFQIGVLAYYLFFEDYPFKGETWKKLAVSIRHDEPDFNQPNVPILIIEFLKKALSKNPEDRFESAVAMWAVWQHLFTVAIV
jgi:eukaryotic-like serine/threonine-protein kinase